MAFYLLKRIESEWFIVKKQTSYLLAAITLVLIVLSVSLYISGRNNLNELNDVQAMLLEVTTERDNLLAEKKQWEADKLLLGKSIGNVKTVLIDALSDLDKVSSAIGAEVLEVEKLLEPKPTAAPAAEEKKEPAKSEEPAKADKAAVEAEKPKDAATDKPKEEKAPTDKPKDEKVPTDKPKEEKAPADKPKDDKTQTDKPEAKVEPAKTDKTEAKDKPSEAPKKDTPEKEKPATESTKKP